MKPIIWTSDGLLPIRPEGTYFKQILTEIQMFSFKKMHLKMSCALWRPSCLGLNVLTLYLTDKTIQTHFLPYKFSYLNQISLKFVSKGPIDKNNNNKK